MHLWYIVFICHQDDARENSIGSVSVYVAGYCGLSENGLCIFGKLCPVGFLIVYKKIGLVVVCSYVVC